MSSDAPSLMPPATSINTNYEVLGLTSRFSLVHILLACCPFVSSLISTIGFIGLCLHIRERVDEVLIAADW